MQYLVQGSTIFLHLYRLTQLWHELHAARANVEVTSVLLVKIERLNQPLKEKAFAHHLNDRAFLMFQLLLVKHTEIQTD